ncbi:MAG TPA: electron transfer flavoprotein subunit beta/FixA family protein [Smithella sp.]|nr:electron transfer flavoprotein subunit beta/FixA family protein [Smithella sp.]
MNIIVCIKQVPGITDVQIDPEDNTLVRENIPSIVNPFDMYAIEEGLRLKEAHGGRVTVISMGPPQVASALKDALGMGADDAVLLTDRAFAGADSWATAYTLSLAVKMMGEFDIIICGRQAIDGDTGQVGPGLARQLGINQLTYISKIKEIDPSGKTITVERLLEEGREIVEAGLPALITVVKDINQPRLATVANIRKASRIKIKVMSAADLTGVDVNRLGINGSPTKVIKIFSPPKREGILELIKADNINEAAIQLVDRIMAEKIL